MMAVFVPDLPDDQLPGALERVSTYITTTGGEVTMLNTTAHNTLTLGRRRLAYPINKYRDGYYALYHFNLDPGGITELERELRLNTQVLRHLVTLYTPPKPRKAKKGKDGDAEADAGTTAAVETTSTDITPTTAPPAITEAQRERAPMTSASGAEVDTDVPVPPAPDGTELNEPPTAATPELDEQPGS